MHVANHNDDGTPDGCMEPGCLAAEARGDRWIGPHCSVGERGRAYFHHRDVLYETVRTDRIASFTKLCATLDNDPKNFKTAWEYIRFHPIFHRPLLPRELDIDIQGLSPDQLAQVLNPDHLEDCDGLRNMDISLECDDDGSVNVVLEHGPHLRLEDIDSEKWVYFSASGQASCDIALTAVAPTYEQAIVTLAENIRNVYGDDRSKVRTRFTTPSAKE